MQPDLTFFSIKVLWFRTYFSVKCLLITDTFITFAGD